MILRGSACRAQTGARRVGSAVAGCEGPGDGEGLHLEQYDFLSHKDSEEDSINNSILNAKLE